MRSAGFVALTFITAAGSACHAARREVRVGGDAATLKVSLSGPITQEADRKTWLYELSGCIPVLTGTIDETDAVSFTAIGLKKDLPGCQLRVKTVGTTSGITPVAGVEPNVLYWAKNLEISQDANGALVSQTELQQLFTVTPSPDAKNVFSLHVPVIFKTQETAKPMTAAIVCTPSVSNIGVYPDTNPVDGEFVFSVAVDRATPFHCTTLQVSVAGVLQKYTAEIKPGNGDFTGAADQAKTLLPLRLMQQETTQPANPTTPGGVVVNISPEDCTADGKIFDTAKHECVDTPGTGSGSGSAAASGS